jgi:hypothetical protein
MGIESFFVRNLFILHCLWKSEESEDCDSKLHSQDDVPSIARETSAAPAATFKRSNRKLNHHSAVANCVASSAPELPRRSTNSAKRPRLWLNELERNRPFRNRQVAGSIPALGSVSLDVTWMTPDSSPCYRRIPRRHPPPAWQVSVLLFVACDDAPRAGAPGPR